MKTHHPNYGQPALFIDCEWIAETPRMGEVCNPATSEKLSEFPKAESWIFDVNIPGKKQEECRAILLGWASELLRRAQGGRGFGLLHVRASTRECGG